jgi:hypothetical protein
MFNRAFCSQELFGDFYGVNKDVASLNIGYCSSALDVWGEAQYVRARQGLAALLLALKKKPLIRYQRNSNMCKRLAMDIAVCG